MVKRARASITAIALLALFGVSACGVSTQHTERYLRDADNPDSAFSKSVDRFRIQLLLNGTREESSDSRDSVFADSVTHVRAPHTLNVSTAFYGTTDEFAEVHSITIRVDGQAPVVLHGRDHAPIRLQFEPWLDHALAAGFELPLGDTLPFVDGQQVIVNVEFVPPESTELHAIQTVFRAEFRTKKRSKLRMLLQGG